MKQCIRWLYGIVLVFVAMCATAVSAASSRPVVFLHGWNSDGSIWENMMDLMVKSGNWSREQFTAPSYINSSWWKLEMAGYGESDYPISVMAAKVFVYYVKPVLEGTSEPIDFVVHSMGGILLRQMIAGGYLPVDRIGRVVDLATPHYGQAQSAGQSAKDMYYGSEVLWNLAVDWSNKVPPSLKSKWLNIAGITHDPSKTVDGISKKAHSDWLVDQWSAGLIGSPVRYVNKCHANWFPGKTIYACGGNDSGTGDGKSSDIVFQLGRIFLESETIIEQSYCGVDVPTDEGGGIFLQVVDKDGNPIPWEGNMVAKITEPTAPDKEIPFVQLYGEPKKSQKKGICLLAYEVGTYRGFDPGVYDIEFNSPLEKFGAFTARGIKVESNRTRILQIIPPSRILVGICIDCSGSMGDYSRMENAIASAQRRIDNIPDGVFVEILKFNSGWDVVQPFVEIKTNADGTSNRDSIKEAIGSITAGGGTDILKAGNQMLKDILANDPQHTAVRNLILLTDGEDENFKNNKESFIQACNEAGVSFNSIAYGSGADAVILDEVSHRTGGSHFASGDSSTELDQAFERTVNDILNRVSLLDWECLISGESTVRTFEVDANTPSVHTVVHVGEGYSVVLRHNQSGRMCTATERSNGTSKTCTFDIADPPAGTWQVVISRTLSTTADCEASVLAVAPAATEADAPAMTIDVQQTENAVRATLRKGGLVKGAQVSASCRVGDAYREIAMSEESPGVYYLDLLACGNFSGGLTVSATATAGTAVVVSVDGEGNVLAPLQEKALSASFTRARHLNISKFSDAAVRNVSVHPRWPWEEKVDVDFDVATIDNNTVLSLGLSGLDEETGYQYVVESVSCDEPVGTIGPGRHRLTWDAGKDVPNADFESFAIRFDVTPRAMLAAVTGVTASAGTYFDGVHVSWGVVSNATGYRVWRSDNPDGTGRTLLTTQTGRTYTDASAVIGKQYYYYWIQPIASWAEGLVKYEGPFSDAGEGWRGTLGGISGLSASSGSHYDGVHLSWTGPNGATSYRIYRGTTANASAKTQIATSTSTYYIDTTAAKLQKYYYYWVEPIAVVSGTTYVGTMNSSGVSGWRNKLGTPTIRVTNWHTDREGDPEIDLYIDSRPSGATRIEYMSGDKQSRWNAMEAVGEGSSGYEIYTVTQTPQKIAWAWAYRTQLRIYVRAACNEGVSDWVKWNLDDHRSELTNPFRY